MSFAKYKDFAAEALSTTDHTIEKVKELEEVKQILLDANIDNNAVTNKGLKLDTEKVEIAKTYNDHILEALENEKTNKKEMLANLEGQRKRLEVARRYLAESGQSVEEIDKYILKLNEGIIAVNESLGGVKNVLDIESQVDIIGIVFEGLNREIEQG